jgi:hypothetical protein
MRSLADSGVKVQVAPALGAMGQRVISGAKDLRCLWWHADMGQAHEPHAFGPELATARIQRQRQRSSGCYELNIVVPRDAYASGAAEHEALAYSAPDRANLHTTALPHADSAPTRSDTSSPPKHPTTSS